MDRRKLRALLARRDRMTTEERAELFDYLLAELAADEVTGSGRRMEKR